MRMGVSNGHKHWLVGGGFQSAEPPGRRRKTQLNRGPLRPAHSGNCLALFEISYMNELKQSCDHLPVKRFSSRGLRQDAASGHRKTFFALTLTDG